MRRDQVHPAECCCEGLLVVKYFRHGLPIEHNETIEIFFCYTAGVEERLSVAIVMRCEVFVEIGNKSAIICADSSNNEFKSPIDADLSEWGSSKFEGRFTFKDN